MHKDRSTIFTVKISDLVQYVIFSQLILSTSKKKLSYSDFGGGKKK
jgi:hypothetical protein